ncbi:MAG: hypothetical protein CMH11_03830 [Maritimibacter sp.]|nr:hypothetical protein [Maritimibacter sp.]
MCTPVRAEVEVHVIAIGKGRQTDDFYALPESRVLVDRPDADVALVLLDGGETHWRIETTPETRLVEVIRGGRETGNSRVTLSGIPMVGVATPDLPLVYKPVGVHFRALLTSLTRRFGTDRIASFHGMHRAGSAPLRVDRLDTGAAALSHDYLATQIGRTDDLPAALRDRPGATDTVGHTLTFDQSGITLTDPTGVRHFPVPDTVPPVLLPAASVHDPASGMIYALTYGGVGYIYGVDGRTGAWRVVAALDDYDASGLIFDPATQTLITTGAFSRPGDIRTFSLDGARTQVFVPTTRLPGLTDLFDYGNEHSPPLRPHLYRDGWLLASATADPAQAYPDATRFRLYAFHTTTGEVRLLAYGDD